MSFVAEISPEVARAAGRVAALAELQDIKLVEGRASLSPSFVEDGCRVPSKGWAVDISHHSKFHFRGKNILCAVIDFKFAARQHGSTQKQPSLLVWAKFLAEYEMAPGFKPSESELRAFLSANATFNCWPYWREYVHSTAARMNLPPLTLPFFRVRSRRLAKPEAKHLSTGADLPKR
jgi:hypothetical protein